MRARRASLSWVQAASGLMASNGHEETGPTRTVSPVIDVTTGLMAALAISSALHRRSVTGEGQHIDVSAMDAVAGLADWSLANFALNRLVYEFFNITCDKQLLVT